MQEPRIFMLNSLFFAFFSFVALASADVLHFKISPGKLHSGGKASARIQSVDSAKDQMLVFLTYEIVKKALVPVPEEYLKGTEKQLLPLEFIDERGYLNLEANGPLQLTDATVYHLGRVKLGGLINAHLVKIVAKNGKSEIEVTYHPQLPELGWAKVKLTIFTPIPIFKNYSIEAALIN
jgi:hypothetical protein